MDEAWESERANVEDAISFFREQYSKDPEFAIRVDEAVRRILRTKLRLYGNRAQLFQSAVDIVRSSAITDTTVLTSTIVVSSPLSTTANVELAPPAEIFVTTEDLQIFDPESESSAEAADAMRQVAREALAILHPDTSDTSVSFGGQPGQEQQIVIFSG